MITARDSKGRIEKGSGKKHGLSDKPIYDCWVAMKARCSNTQNPAYKYYGSRGIRVCNRWQKSFINFYKDMGDMPQGKTLDRIDVYGNYEPSNCRWITHHEQQLNRRDNCSFPGVTVERNLYRADITVKGVKHFLGRYKDRADAIKVRLSAEKKHGIYRNLSHS